MLDGQISVLAALAKNKEEPDHPGHWQHMGCSVPPYWLKPSAWKKEAWKMKERAMEFFLKGAWMNRTERNPCQSLQAPSHSSADNCWGGRLSSVAGSHSSPLSSTSAFNCRALQVLCFQRHSYFQTPPERWLFRNETLLKDPKEERTLLLLGAHGLSPEVAFQLHLVPAGGLSLTLQFMIARERSVITEWGKVQYFSFVFWDERRKEHSVLVKMPAWHLCCQDPFGFVSLPCKTFSYNFPFDLLWQVKQASHSQSSSPSTLWSTWWVPEDV